MIDSNDVTDEGLVRAIGTWALSASVVNMVVGAGIFVLPGIVAALLGPAAILAYLACSVAVALVFLCFAEIGSRVTRSGGSYAYIEEAFGPFAGFVASTLLWLGWAVFGDAALSVAMVDSIATVFPLLSKPVPRSFFIIGLFTFLAAINLVGVKAGMRLMVFNTIAKLIPLLLLASVGLFAINFEYLAIIQWPSIEDFGAAALILFFAFAGAETALAASGEIKNPSRTIPRALLLGISAIFILYVALQTVAQGSLGPALANNLEAPLAATATQVLGSWGAGLLLIGGVISIFGALSGDVLATPRVLFAAASDGHLPKILAKVHPKYQTPYLAIIFYAAIGCVFALTGSFKQLAVVASGSILVIYLGVSLAVIRLRHRDGEPSADQFRLPGGASIPILSSLVVLWLISRMESGEAIGFAVLLAIVVASYFAGTFFRKVAKREKGL